LWLIQQMTPVKFFPKISSWDGSTRGFTKKLVSAPWTPIFFKLGSTGWTQIFFSTFGSAWPNQSFMFPWGVGGWLKISQKNPARAGWPRLLALVRATWRTEVDVIGAQLCSCARTLFTSVTLSWSDFSLPLIFVDNSPNLHNTGLFPDCYLLSITDKSIWIPYFARYSDIFRKPNFQVVKWKSTFIWKILSQAELETEG